MSLARAFPEVVVVGGVFRLLTRADAVVGVAVGIPCLERCVDAVLVLFGHPIPTPVFVRNLSSRVSRRVDSAFVSLCSVPEVRRFTSSTCVASTLASSRPPDRARAWASRISPVKVHQ
jgi:hypothetical protein